MRLARVMLLSCITIVVVTGSARAQVTDFDQPAISLERLWLQPGPGSFVAAQDAQLLAPGAWSYAVLGTLMKKPIVLTDLLTGEEAAVPVDLRLGYELVAARGMSERLQLGFALPMVAAQGGDRLQGIGLSDETLAPIALGDIRLHGKLRLQEDQDKAYSYGAAFSLTFPTGNQDHFAGERGVVIAWTLIAGYAGQNWRVATNLGFRLRTEEVTLISPARPNGNELIARLAGEFSLPKRMEVPLGFLLELSQVRGDDGGPSPGEVLAGVVGHVLPRARLKLVAGGGYTPDEVGAPAWRVAVIFEYDAR